MATYEYICKADGHTVKIIRGMTEKEILPYCDKCNEPMNRVFNAPPIKFNGTGFYSTDN